MFSVDFAQSESTVDLSPLNLARLSQHWQKAEYDLRVSGEIEIEAD